MITTNYSIWWNKKRIIQSDKKNFFAVKLQPRCWKAESRLKRIGIKPSQKFQVIAPKYVGYQCKTLILYNFLSEGTTLHSEVVTIVSRASHKNRTSPALVVLLLPSARWTSTETMEGLTVALHTKHLWTTPLTGGVTEVWSERIFLATTFIYWCHVCPGSSDQNQLWMFLFY